MTDIDARIRELEELIGDAEWAHEGLHNMGASSQVLWVLQAALNEQEERWNAELDALEIEAQKRGGK